MLLIQVSFDAGFFSVLLCKFREFIRIRQNLPVGRHFRYLLSSITSAFMIDISMSFKFYYLPTFRNYFSVFLIFLFVPKFYYLPTFQNYFSVFLIFFFVPGVFCCQHHLESRTTSARWKGVYDLTEIWKDYGGSCSSM